MSCPLFMNGQREMPPLFMNGQRETCPFINNGRTTGDTQPSIDEVRQRFGGAKCVPYWPGLSSCPFSMTSSGVKRRPGSERASARAMSVRRYSATVDFSMSKTKQKPSSSVGLHKTGVSEFSSKMNTPFSAFQLTPLICPVAKNFKTGGSPFVTFVLDVGKVEN